MRFHLPWPDDDGMDAASALYTICVDGHLGPTLLSAFPAMAARQEGAHTLLTGLLDQSALFGVLAEVEALGLCLLEVRRGVLPEPGDDNCHRGVLRREPSFERLPLHHRIELSSSDD
jgi:hypothetical protein